MIPTLILAGKVAAFLLVAACIVRARENARIRRVRREMRAELLASTEQDRYDREFVGIVAHWRADA